MADAESLKADVNTTGEHATQSLGQLKDDVTRVAQSAADVGRAHLETVKGKLQDGQEALKTKLNDGREAVRSKLNDGREAVKTKLSDGRDAVHDAADRAKSRGNDLLANLQDQVEQNPLQAVAIAAGVGVLVGLLLRRQ